MFDDDTTVRSKFVALRPVMDELGEGGIAIVERATGLSRTTIRAGRDTLFKTAQAHPCAMAY